MLQQTLSATPLEAVTVERFNGITHVWMRRNISHDWQDLPDGGSREFWSADELHGTTPDDVTADEVLSDFDSWWDSLLTDRELAEKAVRAEAGTRSLLGTSDGTAKRNYLKGELVMTDSAAYVATANIPRGATLVEGMNVLLTDMEELLNELQKGEQQ